MATSHELVRKKIEAIIVIIKDYDTLWPTIFNNFLMELSDDTDISEFVRDILKLYQGGMGSFSDLVLQKNGEMLVEDNDKLALLKKELYQTCEMLI